MKEININLPGWVEGLDKNHWLKNKIISEVKLWGKEISKINDVRNSLSKLTDVDVISSANLKDIELGQGIAYISMRTKEGLFYNVLEEITGCKIEGDYHLFGLIQDFSRAKKEFDKIETALISVKETGYGLVAPGIDELELQEPEIFKHGNRFGVKLRANAPSLHFIRADIATEISPLVGTEKESEELLKYLLDEFQADPTKIWQTNMFGKSLHDMIKEQLQNKLFMMPDDARVKLQRTLQKIVNDGSGGLICIIL